MKEKYSMDQMIVLIKAFHLDSVQGKYNKELLDWCNNWIDYNIKENIHFETYISSNKEHKCRYSKSMNQTYPRLCIECGKPEADN